MTVGRLVHAICEAYRYAQPGKPFAPLFADGRWYTYCNEAFNMIAVRMDYDRFDKPHTAKAFDAMLANQMADEMAKEGGDWEQLISADEAQECANEGRLVAAIAKNANGPGHVCVVMPGICEFSGSWGDKAPSVMNVGKEVFIGLKASHAFTAADKPQYYVLKSDGSYL